MDLNGVRDYTMTEVTRILGAAIGQPDLRYAYLPDALLRKGMIDSGGLTPDAARLALEINHAISTGKLHAEPRSAHNTTPTTLEDFARTSFAPRVPRRLRRVVAGPDERGAAALIPDRQPTPTRLTQEHTCHDPPRHRSSPGL